MTVFNTSDSLPVILICGPTDMRKSIDGLTTIVAYDLEQEPSSDRLFVFCGRTRNRLKILQWSTNGFWLHYKRLEKGVFQWLGIEDEKLALQVSPRQLNWLLDGLPLSLDQAHPKITYRYHEI